MGVGGSGVFEGSEFSFPGGRIRNVDADLDEYGRSGERGGEEIYRIAIGRANDHQATKQRRNGLCKPLRSNWPRVEQGHVVGEVGGVAGDDGEVVLEGGGSEEFLN